MIIGNNHRHPKMLGVLTPFILWGEIYNPGLNYPELEGIKNEGGFNGGRPQSPLNISIAIYFLKEKN
jgi:hypothetical protein